MELPDPRTYSGATITIDGIEEKVPEFSEWNLVCSCCCEKCKLVYFPAINAYFWNQWECRPGFPIFVVLGITVACAAAFWSLAELQTGAELSILMVLLAVTYVFWLISYFNAVCLSPGYAPFYWAIDKREHFTFEQQMDGVVTTQEQMSFAAEHDRPERSCLSQKGRRFVLKADHICKWIGNWVGFKNYRWFYLKVTWGLIHFIVWFVVLALNTIEEAHHWRVKVGYVICLALSLPMLGFGIFFVVMILRHTSYSCHNTSTLEEFRREAQGNTDNPYDLGCWRNYVSIFGAPKYCLCWFLPVPLPRTAEIDGYHWEVNEQEASDLEVL